MDNLCITFIMKKILLLSLVFVTIFSFSACKKKESLSELSKNLTHYEINLNLNSETKQVEAKQTVNYINNTNTILKTLKFHLYPQFFKQGATKKIIPNTKINN